MHFERVTTHAQAEEVRQIRNTGCEWLFFSRLITPEEQAAWWDAHRETARIWLTKEEEATTGFLSIADKGGRDYVTLVVLPEYRGQGIGTAIYREAPVFAGHPVLAAIYVYNSASMKAAAKAGYKEYLRYSVDEEVRVLESASS